MDSLSSASSGDADGWSSKHIAALVILMQAESRQPPVASDTRSEHSVRAGTTACQHPQQVQMEAVTKPQRAIG